MLNEHEHPTRHSAAGRSTAFSLVMAIVGHCVIGSALCVSQIIARPASADELQVAIGNVLTDVEQKDLAEFQKAYRLEKDQTVKYIKPPFLAGRLIDREHRWKDKWMNGDYQKGRPDRAGLIPYCYVYFERDGELDAPHHFASGSDQRDLADQGLDVITVIHMVANVRGPNLIGSDRFSKKLVAGDWVIREGAPTDKIIADLEQVLNRECGIPIKLEYEEDTEEVVIVRRGTKPFTPKLDAPIKIYASTFRPDKGSREQGTFKEFLDTIGFSIQPNMRVISEIESPPKETMSWHVSVPNQFDDGDLGTVLEHLDEQTGLKFTLETLKIKRIYVTRNE